MHASCASDCRNPALHKQSSIRVLPAVERELLGHARHALALTAAVVFPYAFGGQLRQALSSAAPVVGEYLPAPQLLQTEADAAEKVPAAQLLQTEATVTENEPAAQSRHAVAPTAPLCLPALQS